MTDSFSNQPGMPAQQVPQDALSKATSLVNPTMDFLRANYAALFVKFLKVEIVNLVASTIMLLAFGLPLAGALVYMGMPLDKGLEGAAGFVRSGTAVLAVTVLWSFLAILIIAWVSRSISLTMYVMTEDQFAGRQSDMLGIFNRIKFPVLAYLIFNYAILIVFLGLPGAVVWFLKGQPVLFLIGLIVYVLYMILFMLIYSFFVQFWAWEVVIGGKPAVEALGESFSLVRNNLLGVFVFYIIRYAGSILIAIPFAVISIIVEIFTRSLLYGIMFATQSLIALAIALFIYVLAREVVSVFSGAAVSAAILPYTFRYWDAIRKK